MDIDEVLLIEEYDVNDLAGKWTVEKFRSINKIIENNLFVETTLLVSSNLAAVFQMTDKLEGWETAMADEKSTLVGYYDGDWPVYIDTQAKEDVVYFTDTKKIIKFKNVM